MANIPRPTYDALKRQEQQSTFRRAQADDAVRAAREKLNSLSKRDSVLSSSDVQKIQKQFENANKDVQNELQSLREEIGIKLGRQAAETKRTLDDIRGLAQKNRSEIETVAKRVNSLEKKVDENIREIATKIENRRKQSIYYYDRLSGLVDQINNLFPEKYEDLYPEQLNPGLFALQTGLVDVIGNIENGNYEAAIGIAQTRIPDALSMLGKLEFFHNQFLAVKEEADDALHEINNLCRDLLDPPAQRIVFKNDEFEDSRGVGYWAKELFDEIKSSIDDCSIQIEQFVVDHDADGILLALRKLEDLKEDLEKCKTISDNEAHLHYECTYLAYEMSDALESNGLWRRVDGPWPTDESDLRGPVSVTLTGNGFNIVITCFPVRGVDSEEKGSVGIAIEVFDDGFEKDDVSRCVPIYKGIIALLRESGFTVDDTCNDSLTSVSKDVFLENVIQDESKARVSWVKKLKKNATRQEVV